MSQEQVADLSGIAQNVISRVERNVHNPNSSTLASLAAALDVDPEVFYYLAFTTNTAPEKFFSLRDQVAPIIHLEIKRLYGLDSERDDMPTES